MNIFDAQAAKYDKRVGLSRLALAKKLRKNLLAQAQGEVLEIACGAGANFPFYPKSVTRIVAVDGSKNMIEAAERHAQKAPSPVELIQSPIESLVLEPKSFDTVVSTLSLCAYNDPEQVVAHVKEFAKPDARFLFLEHGYSSLGILRWIQDKCDALQYRHHGCHLNRNIEKILKDAGLVIEKKETKLFGIIIAIVARSK